MRVRVDHDVPGEPGTAFDWFTRPPLLTRWWPSEAEIDLRVDGADRWYWDGPDVTLRGRYTEVVPGARLGFTWSWDHEELPPRAVEITFAPSDLGTRVSVDHEAGSPEEANDYRTGWEHFLGRLAAALADA